MMETKSHCDGIPAARPGEAAIRSSPGRDLACVEAAAAALRDALAGRRAARRERNAPGRAGEEKP